MTVRPLRSLVLLALAAPMFVAAPASATRPDVVSSAYVADEWTDNDSAELPDEPYSQVEATYYATYGITLDGQVRTATFSWLSWADPQREANLTAPTFDTPIVDVAAGTDFGIAIDDDGHLATWGQAPAISEGDRELTYRDVAAAGLGAIGVTTSGTVRYWGSAMDFSFGDVSDVVSADVDGSAAVALTSDGHVISSGGAITGEWNSSWAFASDRADETFTAVDAGHEFAVALTEGGDVVAWGVSNHEQTAVPAFPPGRHAVAVSAGVWMAAAVLDDGSIVQWGTNNADGERTKIPKPRPGVPVVDVDLDRYRTVVTYASLAPVEAPSIGGTPQIGEPLAATAGSWNATPDDLHYTWKRADGTVVGTDSSSYTPTTADAAAGSGLTVTVAASKDGFVDASATSHETAPVPLGTLGASSAVRITGSARVNQWLTTTVTVDPAASPTYQWLRGSTRIPGATGRSYKVTTADVGRPLTVQVVARATGYAPAAAVTAAATSVVTLGPTRLTVTAPTVKTGKTVAVTVKGLGAGERFTAAIGGQKVTGTAYSNGVGVARFTITGSAGKRAITVVGSVSDRRGTGTLTVVKK